MIIVLIQFNYSYKGGGGGGGRLPYPLIKHAVEECIRGSDKREINMLTEVIIKLLPLHADGYIYDLYGL